VTDQNTSKSKQTNSQISFQENGSVFSEKFDDIYFDSQTGYQQSQFVFVDANNIAEKLITNDSSAGMAMTNKPFVIAETGFGTGLNFLLTLKAYQEAIAKVEQLTAKNTAKQKYSGELRQLSFISIEKYPLSKEQLTRALLIFPELEEFSKALISQYPEGQALTLNEHQFSFFNNRVSLKLLFADAEQGLANLQPSSRKQQGKASKGLVDAWYLDGFSPDKNPKMWSEALFEQIARLSKEQSTLSTFTVSGKVRRQLKAVGFRLLKPSGASTNKKKEITLAIYQENSKTNYGYQLRPKITKPQQVSIIGGGIASACAAYVLTKQGIKVTLYCKDNKVAQGASSNAIGALYPLLHQQKDDISLFYQQAFWRAKAMYQELYNDGYQFSHDWCGLLEISYKESLIDRQKNFESIGAWPTNLIQGISKQSASKISKLTLNHGGLFMPNAGWIAPQELVNQLFKAAKSTNRLRIETGINVSQINYLHDKWCLTTDKGDISTNILIVCGGAETIKLNIINSLPLTSVRGQVTRMKTNTQMKKLSTVICHKGYLTPENNGEHCIGATFEKNSFDTQTKPEEDNFNLDMLIKCLPELPKWSMLDKTGSKARLRCMTPDHLPVVGAMPNIAEHVELYQHLRKDKNWSYIDKAPTLKNLYVMTGFGARGLCSAPLLADILAADLTGEPYPVDNKQLFNLSPNRFVIRDLIKRKI